MPVIKYAVQYSTVEVTDAEYDLIHYLYNIPEPHKIAAIKYLRGQYKLGLKEAKDICDEIGKEARSVKYYPHNAGY